MQDDLNIQVSPRVLRLQDQLIAVRRDFHRHPEPAFGEVRTAGIVEHRLRELGYQVRSGVAKTGVIGDIGGRKGRSLMLRFDMDALPILEQNITDYVSKSPGWMHACGHDGHTSIGLGVAEVLREQNWPGMVRMLFQPAEECPGGAAPMIQEGALQDPDVDACLGLHLWNELPVGIVGVRAGPIMASASAFTVHVKGKGGHAAFPHVCADSLLAAASIVTALQTVVSRSVDPVAPAVLTVGEIHAGAAHNVIAETATLRGTIRSFDETVHEGMHKRLEEICVAVARAHGATAAVSIDRGYPAVVNDAEMAALVREAAAEVVGRERVVEPPPSMGGEDMSFFLREKPGCFFFVGSANTRRGLDFPHHNPRFDFDEDALAIGAEVMLRAVRRYFGP